MYDNPEIVISLASFIVAAMATLFVLYQARLMRIHNRLSVRPQLAVEIFGLHEGDRIAVEMRISNNGLGPALIKNHNVFFDGQLVGSTENISSGRAELAKIIPLLGPCSYRSSIFSRDTALTSGAERPLVKFYFVDGEELTKKEFLTKFHSEVVRFDAEIEYECMYGSKHKLDTRLMKSYEKV